MSLLLIISIAMAGGPVSAMTGDTLSTSQLQVVESSCCVVSAGTDAATAECCGCCSSGEADQHAPSEKSCEDCPPSGDCCGCNCCAGIQLTLVLPNLSGFELSFNGSLILLVDEAHDYLTPVPLSPPPEIEVV